ncbi:AmmeMemoRadiSam system radical SAM enzyme [Candidatus Woesearchaeota archaeon]|nr:AmmeMemoRadiSam system radical SAM enzyme [Candidatus Woesearchaeota archaeon]
MHEAILYKKLENKKVACTACSQKCIIAPDNTGICGVRQNKNGKLYLLVYGKAISFNIDPIEKKPLFHFMPGTEIFSLGTVGCNFSCDFCQNWDISQITKELRKKLLKEKKIERMDAEVSSMGYELLPEKIVEICAEKNISSIAYTYNEPTIFFEYAYDTAKLAHKKGIKNVFVTNGYETEEALRLIKPCLNAVNIDLKSFSDEFYKKICKASLQPVLETIKLAYELGIWVEITTLVIPTKNDSDSELKKIAEFIAGIDENIPWHVTAFSPTYKMSDVPPTSYKTLIKAYNIGKKAGLKYAYVGNILDEEHSNTYCPKCNALLIKRSGYYTTIKNLEKGKCRKCSEKIAGVWE